MTPVEQPRRPDVNRDVGVGVAIQRRGSIPKPCARQRHEKLSGAAWSVVPDYVVHAHGHVISGK
eukprot:3374937-Pyramimonas_sp.AAC.1